MALTAASMGGLVTVATTAYAVSAPTITTVTPSSLPQGASQQAVTLAGTNFQSGAKVTSHSGITAKATFVSATQLDLSMSVSTAETPGAFNVIVTNPDGGHFNCMGCLTVTAATTPGADWPGYLFSTGHSSYNAGATAITPSNVGQLAPAWRWTPPVEPQVPPGTSTSLLASPTVVNGVVYQGVKDGDICAVNESTGAQIWCHFLAINTPLPAPPATPSCGKGDYQGIISTPTVTKDPATGKLTVYVYAPDGYLYALDAATGNTVWKGQVYTPSTTVNDYYSWGSPLVANGKVYIGVSSDCDNPLVPGGLQSFDQATGAGVARWTSVAAGQTGASVWSSPALAADGSILVTTGNASQASGQPLYNESIVRLDPSTLAVQDFWQVPSSQQVFDADFGASPTTFTATLGGVATPMVGACNKNGYYYAFKQNALSAGPVWERQITIPYPGGAEECDSAATWDGTHLIETGGGPTPTNQPIKGNTYIGSIQSLDPATGVPIWQSGLNGTIVGSATENGAGLVAAPTYQTCSSGTTPCVSDGGPAGQQGVYLVSVATGAISGFLPTPQSPLFGQPVFVGNFLLLGAGSHLGLTAYQVSNPGPPLTGVSPSTLAPGSATTVTLTGSGFSGSPIAYVSSDGVTAGNVTVVSPTKLTVKLTVSATASAGPRDISVSFPGNTPTVDSCSACLTVTAPSPPTVTAVTPTALGQNSTTSNFSITGTNFASGATVSFSSSGVTASSVTFVSSTSLTATVSVAPNFSSTLGASDVTVTTSGGSGTCAGCLTIDAAPNPTSATPSSLAAGQTTPITVAGTDFQTGLVVSSTAPGVTFTAPASVTATSFSTSVTVSPGTANGSYDLIVTNADGGQGTCTGCFSVTGGGQISQPTITMVSPSSLPHGSSQQMVTLTGTQFQSGAKVTSHSGISVATTFVSATQLTLSVSVAVAETPGAYNVIVTNPDGGHYNCKGCLSVT